MKIYYTTHLDLAQPYVWDVKVYRIPNIGEKVVFDFARQKTFELEVVGIRSYVDCETKEITSIAIDLHIPKVGFTNINDWEAYFRRHVLGKNY